MSLRLNETEPGITARLSLIAVIAPFLSPQNSGVSLQRVMEKPVTLFLCKETCSRYWHLLLKDITSTLGDIVIALIK